MKRTGSPMGKRTSGKAPQITADNFCAYTQRRIIQTTQQNVSDLFLAKNVLPDNQTKNPNVVLAEKKLAYFKGSLRRSFKLITSK